MPTLSTLKRGGELLWSNHKLRIRGRTKEQQAKAANWRGRERERGPESRRHAVEWQNKQRPCSPHPETFGVLRREWNEPPLAIGASRRGPRAAAANAPSSDASRSAPAANQYPAAGSLHSLLSLMRAGKKRFSLSPAAAPPALSLSHLRSPLIAAMLHARRVNGKRCRRRDKMPKMCAARNWAADYFSTPLCAHLPRVRTADLRKNTPLLF